MKENKGYTFERDGKWYARITVTDENGKRRNVQRVAKSKSDAKTILDDLVNLIKTEGKEAIDYLSMTFNDLADYYEKHYAKEAKFVGDQKVEGLRAIRCVKGSIKHFRQFFGKKKIREITYGDILTYRTDRMKVKTPKGTTRSIASMNRELAYLRRIFNIADRQGWINKNPINCGDSLILISAERRRERILTIGEEKRLLAACSGEREIKYKRKGKEITAKIENGRTHLKVFIIALLDTGARKGEMLKLTWQYVDFQNRIITIQARNTKTLRTRQVAITQRLYDELHLLWETSDKNPDSLVFGVADNVKRSFMSACKDAGIKHGGIDGLTLHCLRHTAATRLVNGQLPIEIVGRILGHSQPQTTYRYISANNQALNAAKNIFENLQA